MSLPCLDQKTKRKSSYAIKKPNIETNCLKMFEKWNKFTAKTHSKSSFKIESDECQIMGYMKINCKSKFDQHMNKTIDKNEDFGSTLNIYSLVKEMRRATKPRKVNFDIEHDLDSDFKPKMVDCYTSTTMVSSDSSSLPSSRYLHVIERDPSECSGQLNKILRKKSDLAYLDYPAESLTSENLHFVTKMTLQNHFSESMTNIWYNTMSELVNSNIILQRGNLM